ncbi:MAG: hypothetical protein ACTHMT_02790 [Verrucomicrobiota bacterium]
MATQKKSPLKWFVLFFIGGPMLLMLCTALLIGSFFWVSPEVRALRNTVIENSSGRVEKQLELSVGRGTFVVARCVSPFIRELPEPARIALESARGVQVSIMKTKGPVRSAKILASAKKLMESKGWEQMAGVMQSDCTVAVFVPHNLKSGDLAEACVLVVNEGQVVTVYGKSDLRPLVNFAMDQAMRKWPEIAMK